MLEIGPEYCRFQPSRPIFRVPGMSVGAQTSSSSSLATACSRALIASSSSRIASPPATDLKTVGNAVMQPSPSRPLGKVRLVSFEAIQTSKPSYWPRSRNQPWILSVLPLHCAASASQRRRSRRTLFQVGLPCCLGGVIGGARGRRTTPISNKNPPIAPRSLDNWSGCSALSRRMPSRMARYSVHLPSTDQGGVGH